MDISAGCGPGLPGKGATSSSVPQPWVEGLGSDLQTRVGVCSFRQLLPSKAQLSQCSLQSKALAVTTGSQVDMMKKRVVRL